MTFYFASEKLFFKKTLAYSDTELIFLATLDNQIIWNKTTALIYRHCH